MDINDRIKLLRNTLGLSQESFGKNILLERSTISLIERHQRNVTDRIFNDICREFNVNEEWLRTGNGEIFVEPDTFSLDEYLKQQGATELEMEIIKGYFNIPKEMRGTVLEYFKNIILPTISKK